MAGKKAEKIDAVMEPEAPKHVVVETDAVPTLTKDVVQSIGDELLDTFDGKVLYKMNSGNSVIRDITSDVVFEARRILQRLGLMHIRFGEPICQEDDAYLTVKIPAWDELTGYNVWGTKRQQKNGARAHYEMAYTKAQRNAVRYMLPASLVQYLKRHGSTEYNVSDLDRDDESPAAPAWKQSSSQAPKFSASKPANPPKFTPKQSPQGAPVEPQAPPKPPASKWTPKSNKGASTPAEGHVKEEAPEVVAEATAPAAAPGGHKYDDVNIDPPEFSTPGEGDATSSMTPAEALSLLDDFD